MRVWCVVRRRAAVIVPTSTSCTRRGIAPSPSRTHARATHTHVGTHAYGRRSQAQPPTTPRRALLSPYDSTLLYGYAHGPPAYFAEPLDSWLSVLADAVPLHRDAAVVCASSLSPARVRALTRRATQHLPSAQVAQLTTRASSLRRAAEAASVCDTHDSRCRRDADTQRLRLAATAAAATATTAVATTPAVTSAHAVMQAPPPLPALQSPLEAMSSQSLDVVVFAGNVFAREMVAADAVAWHVSQAHRVLRPHGVLAIVGYAPHVRVVAPTWAAHDADDCLRELLRRARRAEHGGGSDDGGAATTCTHATPLSWQLQRARVADESAAVAHADVYLPFRAVRRRVFCSEYALSPAQLAACYRALPSYALLDRATTQRDGVARRARRDGRLDSGDFVYATQNDDDDEDDDDEDTDAYVRRRVDAVDPLEALEHCLAARLASEVGERHVRVHVTHFVVTCSNRGMNAAVPSYALPDVATTSPRLPR